MYVKVFESRQTSNSYVIQHDISMRGLDHGKMYLENQDKKRIAINEGVEIITLVVNWTKEGEAYFVRDDLPISSE